MRVQGLGLRGGYVRIYGLYGAEYPNNVQPNGKERFTSG